MNEWKLIGTIYVKQQRAYHTRRPDTSDAAPLNLSNIAAVVSGVADRTLQQVFDPLTDLLLLNTTLFKSLSRPTGRVTHFDARLTLIFYA